MILIRDLDESFTELVCDDIPFIKTVVDVLSVYTEGYQFDPRFRAGIWDGKKKFYRLTKDKTVIFPKGLVNYILDSLDSAKTEYAYENITTHHDLKIEDFQTFVNSLCIPFEPYDYQFKAAYDMIINKRGVYNSATGSGKSLIIYMFLRYMLDKGYRSTLVVPTISLTLQMKSDFESYGFKDSDKFIKLIGGEFNNKELDTHPIVISTWQSLQFLKAEQFEVFDSITIDEAHTAKGDSLDNILKNAKNCQWKIGLTGSIPRNRVDKLTLLGTLGKVHKVITPQGLIERGLATPLFINNIYLNYSEQDKLKAKKEKFKYPDEEKFVTTHYYRNKVVADIISKLSTKGNVVSMFSKIEHGKLLLSEVIKNKTGNSNFELLDKITPKPLKEAYELWSLDKSKIFYLNSPIIEKDITKMKRTLCKDYSLSDVEEFVSNIVSLQTLNIFMIFGNIDGQAREDIRARLEEVHIKDGKGGVVVIGSWATISTGVNYKNIHHLVYASSLKSYTKIVQANGRGMRLHESKDKMQIWDIIDDLSWETARSKKENYMLKHSYERLAIYRESEYPISEREIQLQ